MNIKTCFKPILFLLLISSMLMTSSCNEVGSIGKRTTAGNIVGDGTLGGGKGNGAAPTDGSVGSGDDTIIPTVEIRHLVEPDIDNESKPGTYTRKLTLPKNYNGLLYLAGINVSTLADKNIKVRFNMGNTSEPITIPATIATAAGLTPQTGVEVLVMDLRYKPFNNVQLIYDLFDYNDYTFKGSSDPSALAEPTDHNRNSKLFCRSLNLKDDPTFTGDVNTGCKSASSICKYAYAKVVDKGLVKSGTPNVPITPSEINVQSGTDGFYGDTNSTMLGRCLPDNPMSGGSYKYIFRNDPDLSLISLTYGGSAAIDTNTYYFLGPYRPINKSNWSLSSSAVYGPYGIFGDSMSGTIEEAGIKSLLFPIASKFNLLKDVEYLGAATPDGEKTLMSMSANSASEWMDGCNERASTVDTNTGEHVGSCSATATIQIITVDDEGRETIVDSSKDVKLQLVKPTAINSAGEDLLLSSFQSCTSSNQCGSDACCFNKRCWSKTLVSQCVEDSTSYGNQVPGAVCTSDFDCASLCCNSGTGRCAVHDTMQTPEVLCSKPTGQFCIAREWCMKHTVTRCFIVKTGFDVAGEVTCALRCYTSQVFGDCSSGKCTPPPQPEMPVFDPNSADRCDSAIDPPTETQLSGME